MSGAAVVRKLAKKCGAKNPELLTSTRFRKQIATILQLMSFEKPEMEQVARFMGHLEKTHAEFYRFTEDVYQTAKVAKVLLLLNAGKGAEFKGKSLAEIEVNEENQEDEHGETDSEENIADTKGSDSELEMPSTWKNTSSKKAIRQNNEDFSNKTKSNRIRWSAKENKIVLDYLKKHVRNNIPPKKDECLKLIRGRPLIT